MIKRESAGPDTRRGIKLAGRIEMGGFVPLFALFLLMGFGLLLAPWTQPALEWGTAGVVDLCASLVRLLGGHAAARENVLIDLTGGFSIKVNDTCNGSNVTLMLWAAILAFSAPWPQKLKGLAAGTLAIHSLNLVRIISLFYLGKYDGAWFDFAHLYVWESVFMAVTLVIFSLWVQRVRRLQR